MLATALILGLVLLTYGLAERTLGPRPAPVEAFWTSLGALAVCCVAWMLVGTFVGEPWDVASSVLGPLLAGLTVHCATRGKQWRRAEG
ncbi:hypothetical protein [Nocardioides zeae]